MNNPIAQLAYTHGGQSVSKVGVYHNNVKMLTITKQNPNKVIKFGAIHMGKHFMTKFV